MGEFMPVIVGSRTFPAPNLNYRLSAWGHRAPMVRAWRPLHCACPTPALARPRSVPSRKHLTRFPCWFSMSKVIGHVWDSFGCCRTTIDGVLATIVLFWSAPRTVPKSPLKPLAKGRPGRHRPRPARRRRQRVRACESTDSRLSGKRASDSRWGKLLEFTSSSYGPQRKDNELRGWNRKIHSL